MFCQLLLFAFSANDPDSRIIPSDTKGLPAVCNNLQTLNLTEDYEYTTDLVANTAICVVTNGVIAINGKGIDLEGYTNGEKKISGSGVLASLGINGVAEMYTFVVSSKEAQKVGICGKIGFEEPSMDVFITTKETFNKFDLLQKHGKSSDKYVAGMYMLGKKEAFLFNAQADSGVTGYFESKETGMKIFENRVNNKVVETLISGSRVKVFSDDSDNECIVYLKSAGSAWKTEMHGYIKTKENYIYKDSDFTAEESDNSLSKTMIILIVLVSLIVASFVIGLIIYCFFCKNKESESNYYPGDPYSPAMQPNVSIAQQPYYLGENNEPKYGSPNEQPVYAVPPPQNVSSNDQVKQPLHSEDEAEPHVYEAYPTASPY